MKKYEKNKLILHDMRVNKSFLTCMQKYDICHQAPENNWVPWILIIHIPDNAEYKFCKQTVTIYKTKTFCVTRKFTNERVAWDFLHDLHSI